MDERCLMRGVVVQDEVHVEVGWHLHVNAIQELAELGSAVPPMQFACDLPRGDVQRSEKRRGAVTFVVIGAPLDLARPHRQRRLGSIEGLDLALLIGAQHQRSFRWVEIQTDNVADLLDQLRIGWPDSGGGVPLHLATKVRSGCAERVRT